MRLLFVTQYDPSNPAAGGPVFKVRALSHHMARLGHSVTILTAATSECVNNADRSHMEEIDGSIQIIRLRTLFRYRSTTVNPAVGVVALREAPRSDVIHLFGFYDFMAPVVARVARANDIPYILEPMGMLLPIVRSLGKKRRYHIWLGRSVIADASQVIATAPQEREELIEAGVSLDNISVRRNGIDLDEFASLPKRGTLRQRLGIAPEKRLVLYLGLISRKKNPDLLLRAFANINSPDVHLVIAGPDAEGCLEELRGLRDLLGLQLRVVFPGPLYGEDKLAALVDADVFVLPSKNENFGNVIAESIAAGTPVVISDKCGIAPYVRDKAGLVVPLSRAAVSNALSRLLFNPELYQRLKEGCKHVARELSWDEPVAQLHDLYRSLLA